MHKSQNKAASSGRCVRLGWLLLGLLGALPAQAQTIEFLAAAPSVYENGTNVSVIVTRTPATGVATVDFTTVDGSATAGLDYQATSGTLAFDDGETFKIITIPIINDLLSEGTETFLVTLSNPTGATLGLSATTVTIFDDDTFVRLSSTFYGVREDGTNVVIEVWRTNTTGVAQVDFYTSNIGAGNTNPPALAGLDYTPTFGTLLFTNGQGTNIITIPILDDCLVESNEVFLVILTNAISASLGAPTVAEVRIQDNDTGAGTLGFSSIFPFSVVPETVGSVRVEVSRACGTKGAISVSYRAVNGIDPCPGTINAQSGTNFDYSIGGSGTLNWADGDGNAKSFTITINNDSLVELDEVIMLTLFNPTGGAVIDPTVNQATVTILFDDQPAGAADRNYNILTALNPTPGANNTVYAVGVYSDTNDFFNVGKSIIGGDFSAVNAVVRNGVARLNANGSVDTTFDPGSGADGFVGSVLIQPDGRILIGGGFSSVNNISRYGVARLNANGSLDSTFSPGTGTDAPVLAMDLQADGKVVIVGEFTVVNSVPRNRIARLNADGSVDTTFNPVGGADNAVFSVAAQPDGRVLVGGLFLHVNGTGQASIARLNPDGSVDPTFAPLSGADNAVFAITLQPNGFILIGGAFSTYDGLSRRSVARLNPDGTLDTTFGPCEGAEGPVYALRLQANGLPVIAGDFISYGGAPRKNIARLYQDGTLDTSFLDSYYNQAQPGTDQFITSMGLQPDGNIMIGGGFSAVGGGLSATNVTPIFNVARLIGGLNPPPQNMPGNVEFVSGTYSIDENVLGGLLTVTVRRINGSVGSIAVDYATSDGTAIAGSNYVATFGTVSWLDCEIGVRTFTIPILDNAIVDGNHTFNLTLSNPRSMGGFAQSQPALALQCSAVVTIVDNDVNHGVIGFSSPTYGVNENGGSASITVVRTNGSTGAVNVQYATSNGTAVTPSDYTPSSGTLRFESGETLKTFLIPIINDNALEYEETVNLRLFNVTGGAALGRTNATLLIFDNDNGPGSVSFSTENFTVTEGTDTNTTNYASIILRRTSGVAGTVAVDAFTVELPLGPGIARAGVDYLTTSNHLVFGPGVTNQTLRVPILPDRLVEGNETLGVSLANVTGGGVGFLTNATLTILDDDFYGSLAFSDVTYYFSEKATNAVITVVRVGGDAEQVSADYFTTDGTATNGLDYTAVSNTLVFPDKVTVRTFSIPILDDNLLEFDETVFLTLTNFAKATPGAIISSTLLINDDEALNVPAGTVDTLFSPSPGPDGFVNAIVVQTNGTIVIAGAFSSYNGVSRNRIARLNADASLDLTFNPRAGANGTIHTMALQPDQKVLVGGEFTAIATTNRNFIARLNQTGGMDTSFNPGAGADNPVYAIALQADGKILIGGDFTTFNGVPRNGIARLNANGTLDATFNPGTGANGTVRAIVVQNDGKILIGGGFILVNNQSFHSIARLNPDGSLDSGFNPGAGADGPIRAIALQSDGTIIIGGLFNNFDGEPRNYLARLEQNGSLDFDFSPGSGPDNSVLTVRIQSDDKILIAGEFTSYNGLFERRVARLNPDASVDPSINFGTGADGFINALALQTDQQMVIGGGFTSFNGLLRRYVARVVGGINLGAGSFQFESPAYTVNEDQTNITVTVIRTGGLAGQVSVDYFTADDTATAGLDYTNVSSTLVLPEGETRGTFVVPIINDSLVESNETVILVLTNATGGADITAPPMSVLTIVSDDSILAFSTAAYSVNENAVGGNAVIPVVRTGATLGTVSVDYFTIRGTATPGADYVTNSGTITFGPGETNKTFSIAILDDLLQEGNEDLTLVLTNAQGAAVLGLARANLTIVDNDFSPGLIAFSAPSFSVSEHGTNAVITFIRTNGSLGVVTVQYVTSGGTATPGLDYTPRSGTLGFSPGQTNQTLLIPIINDSIVEGDEYFVITISNPTGGAAIIGSASANVLIEDDEFGPGSLDPTFNPGAGPNFLVRSVALQTDGKAVIGGAFTSINGVPRNYAARLNTNGTLDVSFNSSNGPSAQVNSVVVQPTGKVVVGGVFDSVNGVSHNRVVQFLTDGNVDPSFIQPNGLNAAIYSLAGRPDGKVVIGGGFSTPLSGVGQLKADGSTDASFFPGTGANGIVYAVMRQADGKVIVGGEFTSINGLSRSHVARLLADGSLDNSFVPPSVLGGSVYAVGVDGNGKVVLGGSFTSVGGGTNLARIARLNADGSLDAGFVPSLGANSNVFAVAIQSDNKVLVAGDFTSLNGTNRSRIGRFSTNGTTDLVFDPGSGANNTVFSMALLSDGRIMIAGSFTTVSGAPRNGIARLNTDPPPIQLLTLPGFNGAQFTLRFNTQAGRQYAVDAGTNFGSWVVLGTNTAGGSTLDFTDTNSAAYDRRFYRVRQVGP